jgi:hypothetical protein
MPLHVLGDAAQRGGDQEAVVDRHAELDTGIDATPTNRMISAPLIWIGQLPTLRAS